MTPHTLSSARLCAQELLHPVCPCGHPSRVDFKLQLNKRTCGSRRSVGNIRCRLIMITDSLIDKITAGYRSSSGMVLMTKLALSECVQILLMNHFSFPAFTLHLQLSKVNISYIQQSTWASMEHIIEHTADVTVTLSTSLPSSQKLDAL